MSNELKPCPFCGDPMRRDGEIFSHTIEATEVMPATARCYLRHTNYHVSWRDWWNTRAQVSA